MDWGSPEFVLAIMGIFAISGVLKSWGKSAHAHQGGRGKRLRAGEGVAEPAEVDRLRSENAQLRDRLEMHEDRIIVLEKIVTGSGFDIAHQIEALRDRPRVGAGRGGAAS